MYQATTWFSKTANGGTTWVNVPIARGSFLKSVFFTSSNTRYCSGGGGTILKSTDSGNSRQYCGGHGHTNGADLTHWDGCLRGEHGIYLSCFSIQKSEVLLLFCHFAAHPLNEFIGDIDELGDFSIGQFRELLNHFDSEGMSRLFATLF